MKTFETSKQKEEKAKKNKMTVSIIIAVIMISSTIGYAIFETSPKEKKEIYNNHNFIQTENGWQTQVAVSDKIIALNTNYLPQEVENITSNAIKLKDFSNKNVFIVSESSAERLESQKFNILNEIVMRMQLACPYNSSSSFCSEYNLPEKNCDDADYATNIIILKESNETSISFKNSCLVIEGNNAELTKAVESAVFRIFNIIQ